MHFKHLTLLLRAKGLAGAIARTAMRLHLLDHRPHADDLYLHTPAVALPALLHAFLLVDHLPGDRHLLGGPVVQLLKRHLQGLLDVLRLLAPLLTTATPAAAAAEEGVEDVARVARTTAILEALLAVPVVLRSLLGIAQHLVGPSDLLELLRITALVGVVLHCQLPIGLLDVRLGSALLHLEELVELCGVRILATAAATLAAHTWEVAAWHPREAPEEHGCHEKASGRAAA
mmetsp:Transcript_62112/g.126485  ORF Transcript_62112/g.126485 Transcript_62112/m.126485 type:complete len:231 (+) Transcript_62112:976-1668(+)